MSLRLIRASVIVTVLSLAGMGANFAPGALATLFGADRATDAYLAAATIPTLANTVFLTAMNITFIPVFIEYENKANSEEAWKVVNSFIVIVLAALTALCLVGSLFSESLILLIAPGLGRDAAALSLAAELQRIQLPAMIFMAWGGLLAGLFYARQSFVIPTLGPLLANLITLGVAWVLVKPAGIHGVAVGVLVGNIVQVIFLLFYLRTQFQGPWRFDFTHPGVRQIGWLMIPWLLGAMIYKANPLVDRFIASYFSAGAITILGYAYGLVQVAVFASSKGASLVVFPLMSKLVNTHQQSQLPTVIDNGLRLVISALVPLMVLLFLVGDQVVAVVLQRGAFSADDTHQTTLALVGYSGSIVALAAGNILTYVYYALQDTRTPAIVGSVGMALNLALALWWRPSLGFVAPAVSYSVMTLFNLFVFGFILRRRLGQVVRPGFWTFCSQMLLIGGIMAGAVWLTRQSANVVPIMARWQAFWQLAYQSTMGLACWWPGVC
ncbi:MAG: murein biosynthesis integral membrane protein MurJ [Chloroflexi bacterium]|nr:murein biosynthesis integral membrane protein MurJ [Chloroflexota bacterium]